MNFDYKKSLGQNFLKDKNIIQKISESIKPSKDDLIIEIGPGAGALTRELIKKDCDVVCFEIDERLKEYLYKIEADNLKIVFADFLKVNINDYINVKKYKNIFFVGNLPYYITTAIINKIVEESNPYEITIMIQKEVAERFMANNHTKQYGSISVFLQYNFDIKKVCNVSKQCFEPIPKVDSEVICLHKHKSVVASNEDFFYQLVKDSFAQKRKTLKNNLKKYGIENIDKALSTLKKEPNVRAEELSIADFVYLCEILNKKNSFE